jgi:RNA polymerase sigma-70 factor (ECF subfamily)
MASEAPAQPGDPLEDLTRRYAGLVYRAAVRRLGAAGADAEDVTQAVFLIALRKARTRSLPEESRMAGWLLKVTRYAANQARRADRRRQRHEQAAAARRPETTVPCSAPELAPAALDEALLRFGAVDRELLVRRYLQGQPVNQVAAVLGLSENTASQRLRRALEKLRKRLTRQNLSVAALTTLLLAESAKSAPPALLTPIRAASTTGQAASIAKGASLMMKLAAAKTVALVACAILALGVATSCIYLRNTAAPPAQTARASAELTRIREQIYILRNSVVFIRTPETYAAVRELAAIGKPAVPELCAELYRLDQTHDGAFRTIAFTLRIIDDPRAVPALIDALPKTAGGGDCVDRIFDRDLWNFVSSHPLPGDRKKLEYPMVSIPRADREVVNTLNTLTRHRVSDSVDYNARDTAAWHDWWLAHWQDFLTQKDADAVKPAVGKDDPVAAAGVARFGPLFPTGPRIRVGPIHEVALAAWGGADSKTTIDFDTDTVSSSLDQGPQSFAPFKPSAPPTDWVNGNDAFCITYSDPTRNWVYGQDVEAWRIDNARWDSIESEVRSGQALDLGRGGVLNDFHVRSQEMRTPTNPNLPPATFLFITRERGRGIIQILGSFSSPPCVKFRYRMFQDPEHPAEAKARPAPPAPRPDLAFGPEIKVTLASPVSRNPSALDLDTGETRPAAAEVVRQRSSPPSPVITSKALGWLADWHGDLIVQPQAEGEKLWAIKAVDVAAFPLTPDAWDRIGPNQLTAVFAYKQREKEGFFSAKSPPADSVIYAFKTREGAIGILQVLPGSAESLNLRYKLITGLTPADTCPATTAPPKSPPSRSIHVHRPVSSGASGNPTTSPWSDPPAAQTPSAPPPAPARPPRRASAPCGSASSHPPPPSRCR